ncbi:MAG TPA: hypothetical protein VKT80_12150, partial [Chloroflexota bacterium]|nr:hypothetical protein [Chloroflexota bacterium]
MSRPYISTALTTTDMSNPTAVQKRTDQTLDQYGNVTSMTQYDFGITNPRTYTNTYLSDSTPAVQTEPGIGQWSIHPPGSNYNAEHIRNRLIKSTVTQGGQTTALVHNSYDSYNPGICSTRNTPGGWQYANQVTSIDPNNTSNIFRGNVTTNYGLDMTHTLCYGTTGAIVMRIDGGHTTVTDTSNQTNYTAPNSITTGSLTTGLNWTASLGLSNETGPNGDGMSIGYDSANRPSTTTTPYGAYTTYSYSINPSQTTATVTTNDPNTTGRKTVTKFDGLGRAIEVDAIDAGGVTRSIVQSQYAPCGCSPMGKLSQQSMP